MTDISSPLPVDPFYTMLASFHGPVQAANLILNEKNHCYQAPYGGLGILPRFLLASITY